MKIFNILKRNSQIKKELKRAEKEANDHFSRQRNHYLDTIVSRQLHHNSYFEFKRKYITLIVDETKLTAENLYDIIKKYYNLTEVCSKNGDSVFSNLDYINKYEFIYEFLIDNISFLNDVILGNLPEFEYEYLRIGNTIFKMPEIDKNIKSELGRVRRPYIPNAISKIKPRSKIW